MRLGVIITLGIGLAVVIMAISATVALLRALDRALGSMELIAASQDFQIRIPADTPDEIGRISRSFNQLLDIAERLLKEKDYLATTDPLTGVNNRLRFAKVLGDEAERKRRTNTPMALVMFDVDHFKRINDTYGHNVGDEVLKALANLVSTEVRVTDFFGRWGGEEFVLLLRDDDCEAAMAAAEKLRNLIASSDIPSVGKVTCSFGVAAWMLGDTEASLVARADKALYESKKGGRNLVTCTQGVTGNCHGRVRCAQ
jgi:diguanylate cyclase (GGDEF)-like protein